AMGEHVPDLIAPFHRLDVPGEGDEIAPIALLSEHGDRSVNIARRQGGVEFAEEGRHPGSGRSVEHRVLPMDLTRRLPQGSADWETCAPFGMLASQPPRRSVSGLAAEGSSGSDRPPALPKLALSASASANNTTRG